MFKYQASEAELSWRFACAGAAIGFAAQSYDFDEPHTGVQDTGKKLALLMEQRQQRAAKAHRIDRSLSRVSAEDRALFIAVYTPRSVSDLAWKALNVIRCGFPVCVIGALNRSETAVKVADRARLRPGCELLTVQEVYEGLVLPQNGTQNASMVARVRDEVVVVLDAALGRYQAVREPSPVTRYDVKADAPSRGWKGDAITEPVFAESAE